MSRKETSAKYDLSSKGKAAATRYRQSPKGKATKVAWLKSHPDQRKAILIKYNGSEKRRAAHLRHEYGITLDDFNALWDGQVGRCAICEKKLKLRGRKTNSVHVDHDHETGKIRGLLCANCNFGLGFFGDNIHVIMAALKYLGE